MMWYILPFVFPGLFVYLTSDILFVIAIDGVLPEIVLMSLVYFGNSRDRLIGQLTGLVCGLTLDFLSAAPLGFFSLIFTVLGYLAGLSKGKLYVDPVFSPLLLVGVAYFLKSLLTILLAGIFGFPEVRDIVFAGNYFVGLLYTLVLTPLFFAFFKLLDKLMPKRRRGGYQD